MQKPSVSQTLLIVQAVALLILIGWVTQQEKRILNILRNRTQEQSTEKSAPAPLSEVAGLNKHVSKIQEIEKSAGVPLSRLTALIIRDEGSRPRPYLDATKTPTIGIGRNLKSNGLSIDELHAIANDIDYQLLLKAADISKGRVRINSLDLANRIFREPLTPADIQLLLTNDLHTTVRETEKVFASIWHDFNDGRKEALIDTVYNLGLPRFQKFVRFIAAVKSEDWETAAAELLRSRAAAQNPVRYFRNAAVIRTGNGKYFDLK